MKRTEVITNETLKSPSVTSSSTNVLFSFLKYCWPEILTNKTMDVTQSWLHWAGGIDGNITSCVFGMYVLATEKLKQC